VDDSYESFGQLNLRDGENEPETLRVSTEAYALEKRAAKDSSFEHVGRRPRSANDDDGDDHSSDDDDDDDDDSDEGIDAPTAALQPAQTQKPAQSAQGAAKQPRRKPGRQGRTRYKVAGTQNKKRGAARKRAVL